MTAASGALHAVREGPEVLLEHTRHSLRAQMMFEHFCRKQLSIFRNSKLGMSTADFDDITPGFLIHGFFPDFKTDFSTNFTSRF